jgi:hypothetical protein
VRLDHLDTPANISPLTGEDLSSPLPLQTFNHYVVAEPSPLVGFIDGDPREACINRTD